MKNKLILMLCVFALLAGCTRTKEGESDNGKVLKGKHYLRKLNVRESKSASFVGSYFLIGGGVSGKSSSEKMISFSWKSNNGDYIISELPLTSIRVRIDSTVNTPYIKFRWTRGSACGGDGCMQELLDKYVYYALIVCKKEDYTFDVNINDL